MRNKKIRIPKSVILLGYAQKNRFKVAVNVSVAIFL